MVPNNEYRSKTTDKGKERCKCMRFIRNFNRIIYKAFTELDELVHGNKEITIDSILEVYSRSGLEHIDEFNKENGLKGLAFLFVCKLNQEERKRSISRLEKEAILEEAEEVASYHST